MIRYNRSVERRPKIGIELDTNIKSRNRDSLNMSNMERKHLKYYNEIAKNNEHGLMNNPTIKDLERITKDESCLDFLQKKEKERAKDLPAILDGMPLKRVERINYKNKEIGHIRRALGEYCLKNPYIFINQEKGEKFAENNFEKR